MRLDLISIRPTDEEAPAALAPSLGAFGEEAVESEGAGPAPVAGWLRRLTAKTGRIRTPDVVVFVRHLATLLGAGLSLSKCLKTVARQLDSGRLAAVVSDLGSEVEGGEMLSSAMVLRPAVFDALTINVVRAGEAGGTLPQTLEQLANDMEKKDALRRTVRGAMVYPAMVISIATLVVGFLLVYVVPTFEDVYRKMHVQLPLITRLLLLVSRMALKLWWLPVGGAVALAVGWKHLKTLEGFRRRWDAVMLRLPVLGNLRRRVIAARFLGAFATLIGSGVTIVESLRLMSGLMDNVLVKDAIDDIRRHVSRGGTLGEPMERHAHLFSPMAIQMVSVGEQTGSLPEAAARTAAFLGKDVDERVKTLTTLIEPLLTVVLGAIVGAIALAIYLPMFDLMRHISH